MGAQYNVGDRRNPESCTFARTDDASPEISGIPNRYRDQLTKGHNEDTATMNDDDSTIDGRVNGTRADDEHTAISMIGEFGNAMKRVPAVVPVTSSTIILTAQARAATTTTGQKETATAQVTTGDGTTFDKSIRMDDDVESNAVAALAPHCRLPAGSSHSRVEGGHCAFAEWRPIIWI